MKKSYYTIALIGLIGIAMLLPADAAKIGDKAPAVTASYWIQGKPGVTQAGQIKVVEFWATWCPPCRTSIPHLNEISKKYADKNVIVIGVTDENPMKVKKFVMDMGDKMKYPVAIGDAKLQQGYMGAFKAQGIPHAFVVGADGKFAWSGHPMSGLEKAIDAAIAKRDAKK